MIIDDITYTMEYIEEIARNLGDILPKESYYIEDEGCPHKQHLCRMDMQLFIYLHMEQARNTNIQDNKWIWVIL